MFRNPRVGPKWIAVTALASLVSLAAAAHAVANPAAAPSSNPSEFQYSYDPIIEAGGSSRGEESKPSEPGERVEEASALIAEIVSIAQAGGNPEKNVAEEANKMDSDQLGVGQDLVEFVPSGSIWLIVILALSGLGFIGWAIFRRGDAGRGGRADFLFRTISIVAFLALIVFLNGSAGSLLG